MLRIAALALGLVGLTGCCCCWGGGSGSSSSVPAQSAEHDPGMFSGVRDAAGKRAAEYMAEKLTGADQIKIDEASGRIEVVGPDGAIVIEANDDRGTLTFQGKDGAMDMRAGPDTTLHAGFPVAVYPGAKTIGSVKTTVPGGDQWIGSFETTDTVAAVKAFYEAQLASHGTISRMDLGAGTDAMSQLMVQGGGRSTMVIITSESGKTTIMVTAGPG